MGRLEDAAGAARKRELHPRAAQRRADGLGAALRRGDFEKSILLAVNGGYDTDCTAATAGATIGLAVGSEEIPARWVEPIGEGVFVGPGILGLSEPKTLGELTDRTAALVGRLAPAKWDASFWNRPLPQVELTRLPGTIRITPLDGGEPVAWANGELPEAVKQAGGATWNWQDGSGESREIVCLVREGAKLFIDGRLVLECPAGLPYVPATHRSQKESRVRVVPGPAGPGTHEVRLELNARDPRQEASVILAYPNLHIAPWTPEELPDRALLPSA